MTAEPINCALPPDAEAPPLPDEALPPRPAVTTLETLIAAYFQEYEVRDFRINIARCRVAHLRAHFGDVPTSAITTYAIRQYQVARRQQGAAPATVNRETSALHRMFRIGVEWQWLDAAPMLPGRLKESQPRQGFFEHRDYEKVRRHLPPPFQDVLDFAYYSGWRKQEILDLTWGEVDLKGGVARLAPDRSKTGVGRILPISAPLLAVLRRRNAKRRKGSNLVFERDGVPVREWRTAFRRACVKAKLPGRLLHDCRRTAARNFIRAGVPERVAMTLTGHRTRCIFDRYNIVNESELFTAGEQLVDYLARTDQRSPQVQSRPPRRPHR